jgi:prepilin-type N-terminal cleavage/methylation domain-containing protein
MTHRQRAQSALSRVERRAARASLAQGFSLVESLVAIAIIGIVAAISIFAFNNYLPTIHSDSSLQLLKGQLQQARQNSVDQRRTVLVTFQGTGELLTQRQNLDVSTTPPTVISTTTLSDYFLPYGMVYTVVTGVPDTPDAFGNTKAVNFNCTVALPSPCTITFQSDGSVVDSGGNYVNGTVFIGIAGQGRTARAVTILGATGRIKGYRYNGSAWF